MQLFNSRSNKNRDTILRIGASAELIHLGEVVYGYFSTSLSVWDALRIVTAVDDVTRIGLAVSVYLMWGIIWPVR
jgi:hypothetical protein